MPRCGHVSARFTRAAQWNIHDRALTAWRPRDVRHVNPPPVNLNTRGGGNGEHDSRKDGAVDGSVEGSRGHKETQSQGQTRTVCTRCPDLVCLTVNSLDGIRLSSLRLTAPPPCGAGWSCVAQLSLYHNSLYFHLKPRQETVNRQH